MALTKIGKEGITGISNASNATAITIDASENVGIGTASPSAPLNISATYSSTTTEQFRIQDNTGGKLDFFGHANGNKAIQAYADDGSTFYEIILNPLGGDVGIGTASPATALHVNDSTNATLTLEGDSSAGASFINFAADGAATKSQISGAKEGGSGGSLSFSTNNSGGTLTERMRIASDGSFGHGTVTTNYSSQSGFVVNPASNGYAAVCHANGTGNGTSYFIYAYNGSPIGSVSQASTSSVAYNTSSDYRLKENVDYDWDATTRLKQLKPARFNFIIDETNTLVDGFIAHEVSSIVPEAITGAKDAMAVETRYTADDVETQGDDPSKNVGDPKTYSSTKIDPQGIDQSKLVPLLVKTIQELEARLTAGGL
jgi:hypothetical protein